MDLLRLALERCHNAQEARDLIIELLSIYGQGGKAGYRQNLTYMNGFLIGDRHEAYVLETVAKDWAWKRITAVWAISNRISLEQDYDACSPGLIPYAIDHGWCKSATAFNFSQAYSDPLITWGARAKARQEANVCHLGAHTGQLITKDMFQFLRYHADYSLWRPYRSKGMTVCAHAANHLTQATQTVGSLVTCVSPSHVIAYATGASSPCLTPYFAVSPLHQLPQGYHPAGAKYDPGAYWWQAEVFHRKAVFRYRGVRTYIDTNIHTQELTMLTDLEERAIPLTQSIIDQYFERTGTLLTDWSSKVRTMRRGAAPLWYWGYWKRINAQNRVPS